MSDFKNSVIFNWVTTISFQTIFSLVIKVKLIGLYRNLTPENVIKWFNARRSRDLSLSRRWPLELKLYLIWLNFSDIRQNILSRSSGLTLCRIALRIVPSVGNIHKQCLVLAVTKELDLIPERTVMRLNWSPKFIILYIFLFCHKGTKLSISLNIYLVLFPELVIRDFSHKLDRWQSRKQARRQVQIYAQISYLVLLVNRLFYYFRFLRLSWFFNQILNQITESYGHIYELRVSGGNQSSYLSSN